MEILLSGSAQRSGKLFSDQIEFWQRTLQPPLPPLELRFARPGPTGRTYEFRRERFAFLVDQLGILDNLLREEHASRFMGLLPLVKGALTLASDSTDIRVATMVAIGFSRRHGMSWGFLRTRS